MDKEELKNLYWSVGLSIRDIAKQKGVAAGTIKYWMLKLGVEIRTQKQACLTDKCRKKNSDSIMQEKHPLWKGRRRKHDGYISIRLPRRYILEHRYIAEKIIGRKLQKDEVVHHINEIKDDNRIKNLFLCKKRAHDRYHTMKRHGNRVINLQSNLIDYANNRGKIGLKSIQRIR